MVCGGCGKYGHVRENFRSHKSGNSNKWNRCGKKGHNESKFWGNKRCKICGETGQNSSNCWGKMKCTKCGKNGHDDQNCWSEIICVKCVSTGHPKKWCKNNSPLNFDSSKNSTTVEREDIMKNIEKKILEKIKLKQVKR